MGFRDLRVVAPEVSPLSREALSMAVHARDVLQHAQVHDTISNAVADCAITIGTTCREGPYRESVRPLRESSRELAKSASTNRIAIIFGPEATGLTNSELKFCQRLITIPTSSEYASINLAQSVMLCAYELRLALVEFEGSGAKSVALELAPANEVDAALERLKESLLAIGFLPEENPEHLMFTVRRIFGRSGLTIHELDIINGIATHTRWAAEGGHRALQAKKAAGRKLR